MIQGRYQKWPDKRKKDLPQGCELGIGMKDVPAAATVQKKKGRTYQPAPRGRKDCPMSIDKTYPMAMSGQLTIQRIRNIFFSIRGLFWVSSSECIFLFLWRQTFPYPDTETVACIQSLWVFVYSSVCPLYSRRGTLTHIPCLPLLFLSPFPFYLFFYLGEMRTREFGREKSFLDLATGLILHWILILFN